MRNAENKPTPLAYGYAENRLLHTELQWAQMDEAYFAKTVGADKPCKKIGAYRTDVKKVEADPVLNAYRMAYRRMHKNMEYGGLEADAFRRWKDEAAQKRDRCKAGELSAEEFLAWLDGTSRRR